MIGAKAMSAPKSAALCVRMGPPKAMSSRVKAVSYGKGYRQRIAGALEAACAALDESTALEVRGVAMRALVLSAFLAAASGCAHREPPQWDAGGGGFAAVPLPSSM